VHLFTLGGDHFITWPLLKTHAAKYGPLALVQFDAHQDTWEDDGTKLNHGSFIARAVREGDHQSGALDPNRHPYARARGLRHRGNRRL
jgi:agmatinase